MAAGTTETRRIGALRVRPGRAGADKTQERIAGWVFVLPALGLLSAFLVWPTVYAFGLSFTNYRVLSPEPVGVVGLANYAALLGDGAVWQAVGNTAYFAAVVVPLQTAAALGLAVLLNERIPLRSVFRTIFFSPVVLSMVVVSILWSYFYNPSQGMFNAILENLGLPRQRFLTSDTQAMPSIMAMSIWQGVGFQMVIFLAGLQAIPAYLYEAAAIDGASRWQRFRSITVPQLRRTTFFVVVVSTILAFKLFTQVYVMTRGGPFGSTRTIIYVLWEEGLNFRNTAYSAALAVLFFLLVLAITLLQRRFVPQDD
jgi:fructooligosaccharide transport system permease protein